MRLVVIIGPPAVGKMAVGLELAKLTGFKLFHNHMTIDLVLNFFDYGSDKFNILNEEFRARIFEEVATSDLLGLIFTFVAAFDDIRDKIYLEKISGIFEEQGATVYYIELEADLEERLRRNKGKLRMDLKPSKRDTERSEKGLLSLEDQYVMNSNEEYPFFFQENYIKIDNTKLSAKEVAKQIFNIFMFEPKK
ncbi:MAG: AAA family ATPase [Candidatus Thorarchaeota archaeon]